MLTPEHTHYNGTIMVTIDCLDSLMKSVWFCITAGLRLKDLQASELLSIYEVSSVVVRKRGFFFSFCVHYIKIGEVIGFSLFRATGLAFAIRPKDSVAKQGRRGGFTIVWRSFRFQTVPGNVDIILEYIILPEVYWEV